MKTLEIFYGQVQTNVTKKQLLLVLLIFSIVQGFSQKQDEGTTVEKPNVIWINCEDISPNLGSYGDAFATTPNLDKLAKEGIVFNKAYATAPICSPARSALITGLYATSLGTQHLRSEIARPEFVKTLPEILRSNGYFTTNYGKTDYNFDPKGIYDYWESDLYPWRKRKSDQPFFSYYVFGMTHEGSINFNERWESNTKTWSEEMFHDPEQVEVPVYHPNSDAFKKIWARYYDNIAAFDGKVGQIMDALEADGLKDNTIVFFFSDHGVGLPRYKRWLYKTGLHVPFIAYIPEKYRKTYGIPSAGTTNNDIVNFTDFTPTVLELAGISVPKSMEGNAIYGLEKRSPRSYTIGARSRADNMYDMSRCIIDGQYIYIRNYMPHIPYIQSGYIFSDKKESFNDLHQRKEANALPAEALKMFGTKAPEELYDLVNDPNELENLAALPEFATKMSEMRERLKKWVFEYMDTGFLAEAEYMIRSKGTTPYEMAHDLNAYDLDGIYSAAELVGKNDLAAINNAMESGESGIRYWGLIASKASKISPSEFSSIWHSLLKDSSPSIQMKAAEYILMEEENQLALEILKEGLQDKREWLALAAARSTELIGKRACPLIPTLNKVLKEHAADNPEKFPYKDYMFSAFISWSVKYALYNCGEEVDLSQ